jgi:hypothetical protein
MTIAIKRKANLFIQLEALPRELFFEKAFLNFPDEEFLSDLKAARRNGRNDYSLSTLWRGILAPIAFKVPTIEAFRRQRELSPFLKKTLPLFPPPSAFSRFLSLLDSCPSSLDSLHCQLLKEVVQRTKMRSSLAIGLFHGLHLLWEPFSGLPLLSEPANPNESLKAGALRLLAKLKSQAPFLLDQFKYLVGDSSYHELIEISWETYQLKPIIPLKESHSSKGNFREATYDQRGAVFCFHSGQADLNPMVFAGFEEDRMSLKYRCLADHYGIACPRQNGCSLRAGIRIPLSIDREAFTPLPRSCYRWKSLFSAYQTKTLLENALCSFSERKRNFRIRLYMILLLAAARS